MLDSVAIVLRAANPAAAILCLLVVGLPIGALIGAVILRAAVSMFNHLAGDDPIPDPPMSKAFGIMILVAISNLVIRFLAASVLMGTQGSAVPRYVSSLVAFPFTFLICSALFSGMLPTSFKRAMLVAVCHTIILLLVAAAIGALVFVIVLALGLGSR